LRLKLEVEEVEEVEELEVEEEEKRILENTKYIKLSFLNLWLLILMLRKL